MSDPRRLRAILDTSYQFVWRAVRRLGVTAGDVDDVTQQVFIICASNLDRIEAGKERAFLLGTAVRVAANARRAAANRRTVPDGDDVLADCRPSTPGLEELLERKRTRRVLDDVLEKLSDDLRAVFVLYEIEQLSMAEIAELLGVPPGTVASRLRRAREQFMAHVDLLRKEMTAPGGVS